MTFRTIRRAARRPDAARAHCTWLLLAAGVAACSVEGPPAADDGLPGAAVAGVAADGAEPLPVVDDAGRTIALAAPPRRIVSLIPAVTEMLFALGAGDRLIARTDYDTNPALDTLPSVGGGLTPDIEWLVARRPDLVVGWTDGTARTVLARLRDLGIPVYSANIQTLADADSTVDRLGRMLGLRQEASRLVDRTRRGLDDVRASVRGSPRPRVLYVLSVDPPMTAGPGTFLHEVIEIAGGDNVFADAGGQWPTIGLEAVVERAPDVLLVPVGEEGLGASHRLETLPGWAELAAVRQGRVYPVDADLFHRPGPHLVDVARTLANLLHPEAQTGVESARSSAGQDSP